MKRFLLLFSLILALVFLPVSACFADTGSMATGPSVTAGAAILMDATTGTILCGKDVDARMYPASLTKIMTAILVIERLEMDSRVIIDDEVVNTYIGGSDIHLTTSDSLTVEQALYLLMMESNNAIAVALAKTVSGSVEAFADLMNARAAELQCADTHFVNPHGLHDDNHYTTVRDLATMTRHALTLPLFVKAGGSTAYDFPKLKRESARSLKNTNWLLTSSQQLYVGNEKRPVKYEGVICGKTGTTNEAGGCLMSAGERDETTLIVVVLNAGKKSEGYLTRYVDCIKYLDWGFERFHTVKAMNRDALLGTTSVKRGSTLDVSVIAPSDQYITLPLTQDSGSITYRTKLFETLQAPVKAGETAGTYELYADNTLIGEYPCVTANDVPEGGILSRFGIPDAEAYRIFRTSGIVLACLAGAAFLGFLYTLLANGVPRNRAVFRKRSRF